MSDADVLAARRALVLALAHAALDDGKVTRAEHAELTAITVLLRLDDTLVSTVLAEAEAARLARPSAGLRPLPGDWSHAEPLRVGDKVAFTSCEEAVRAPLEAEASRLGVRLMNNVSRRTAMLVTDGSAPPLAAGTPYDRRPWGSVLTRVASAERRQPTGLLLIRLPVRDAVGRRPTGGVAVALAAVAEQALDRPRYRKSRWSRRARPDRHPEGAARADAPAPAPRRDRETWARTVSAGITVRDAAALRRAAQRVREGAVAVVLAAVENRTREVTEPLEVDPTPFDALTWLLWPTEYMTAALDVGAFRLLEVDIEVDRESAHQGVVTWTTTVKLTDVPALRRLAAEASPGQAALIRDSLAAAWQLAAEPFAPLRAVPGIDWRPGPITVRHLPRRTASPISRPG